MQSLYLVIILLFFLGICFGIWLSQYFRKDSKSKHDISGKYFEGLNFLLNEQPDKAVDVFIEMIEVNSDTVETHLALGSLFRKRGEVDRAIRIHQNLIARPLLSKYQRIHAIYQLGLDYMRAGVLDRAEELFLELSNTQELRINSLQQLIDIYQQQKDWSQAINAARKLSSLSNTNMSNVIAHYFCELAEENKNYSLDKMSKLLKKALSVNSKSARAHLLQAEVLMKFGRYKQAIELYNYIAEQHQAYIIEAVEPLKKCYELLNRNNEFINFINNKLKKGTAYPLVSAIMNKKWNNNFPKDKLKPVLIHNLNNYPTLHGIKAYIDLQCENEYNVNNESWKQLQLFINNLFAKKPSYQCDNCGFSSKSLYWFCPSCKNWDTVKSLAFLECN